MSIAVLRGLAANLHLGIDVVRPLLACSDVGVLRELAGRPDLTDDMAETLARHENWFARDRLASRPLPEHVLWRLARDSDERLRQQVADRPELPPDIAAHLVTDPAPGVRRAIVWHWESLPQSAVRALFTDPDAEVRKAMIWRAPVPPDLVPAVFADPLTREYAARHLPLTPESAAELAADDDLYVRQAVAANPSCPLPVLLRLAEDEEEHVREEVMLHPALPAEVRRRVVATVVPEDYHVAHWVRDLDPAERLSYVDSEFVFIRRALAFLPDLPMEAVHRLAADEDISVRVLLAENHPDVPGEAIAELIPMGGHAKWDLIKHPNLPLAAIIEFAGSDVENARWAAAHSPRLPADIASELSRHPDQKTRRLVAANPALPMPDILRMLQSDDAGAAAGNPRISEDLARELIREHLDPR